MTIVELLPQLFRMPDSSFVTCLLTPGINANHATGEMEQRDHFLDVIRYDQSMSLPGWLKHMGTFRTVRTSP